MVTLSTFLAYANLAIIAAIFWGSSLTSGFIFLHWFHHKFVICGRCREVLHLHVVRVTKHAMIGEFVPAALLSSFY